MIDTAVHLRALDTSDSLYDGERENRLNAHKLMISMITILKFCRVMNRLLDLQQIILLLSVFFLNELHSRHVPQDSGYQSNNHTFFNT